MVTEVSSWSDVEAAAKEAVSNWKKFQSFGWHDRPDEAGEFAIFYTHHRDSGVLDISNAECIARALEPFTEGDEPDVIGEHHNHWAVGWIDGFAIRVFRDGQVTAAFEAYAALRERLENYPILDEEDYSEKQYEEAIATIKAIGQRKVKDGSDDSWPDDVYRALDDVYDAESLRERDVLKVMKEMGLLEPEDE